MISFLIYILKSSMCLLLFYALYKLLFSATTHFRFNRYCIIAGVTVCMLLPLISFDIVYHDDSAPSLPFYMLEEIVLPEQDTVGKANDSMTVENRNDVITTENVMAVSAILYLSGAAVMLAIWLIGYIRMMEVIRGMKCFERDGAKWILLGDDIRPFSFGRYIVVPHSDYEKNSPVCIHEHVHVSCRHYLDDIFLQLILVFHWFNPALWQLRKELKIVHEYQADNGVLENGIDVTKYQLLLVEKAVGPRLYSMACGFSRNSLKKRIFMMSRKKNSKWVPLRLMLAVPVVAMVLYAFATPVTETGSLTQESHPGDSLVIQENRNTDNLMSERESSGEYLTLDLGVNQRNVYLFNHDLAIKKIDKNTANRIKEVLADTFRKQYKERGEKCVPIVVCIQADRNAKMGAINEIKLELRNAYRMANSELKGDFPHDLVDKCMQPRFFYTFPREYAENPDRIDSEDVHLKGYEIAFFNETKKIGALTDFSISELKSMMKKTFMSYKPSGLTVSLKFPSDATEGIVYDIKQVLRNGYIEKLNLAD